LGTRSTLAFGSDSMESRKTIDCGALICPRKLLTIRFRIARSG